MLRSVIFLVLLQTVGTAVFAQGVEYHGVFVGINDYPGSSNDLSWCVADAQDMQRTLTTYQRWLSDNTTLLTDASAYKSNILNYISAMPRTSNRTNFLHYSGHGQYESGLYVVDQVTIGPSDLQNNFGTGFNQYAAFLDACYAGYVKDHMTNGVISAACGADEYSWENASLGHSVFSYYLIQGLTNNAAGSNGLISAEQLHNYAAPLTAAYQSDQHPALRDNFFGNLYLNLTIHVPSDYSTINAGVSAAVSGQTILVSGNTTLSGNVSIQSGVTLILLPGANVNFNGYYIDQGSGTLTIQNATICLTNGFSRYYALFSSIQTAINTASSGQTVKLIGASYNESPSFSSRSSLTLAGLGPSSTTLNGNVSITNSSNVTVRDLTATAFTLNNSYQTFVVSAGASGSSLATVYGGTVNEFNNVTATNLDASFGLTAYGGTGDLWSSHLSNADCAAFLSNSASYNIGTGNTFCGNGYDIYVQSGGYAYAISNLYSRPLPSSILGNVFVTGVNGVCGGMSSAGTIAAGADPSQQLPEQSENLDSDYLLLLRNMRDSQMQNKYNPTNYLEAICKLIDGYKSLISKGTEQKVLVAALSKLSHLYKHLGDLTQFRDYLTQQLATGNFVTMQPYFARYFIWDYVDKQDYSGALKMADDIMQTSTSQDDLFAEMLYEKGLIYKYYLRDLGSAEATYASLKKECPWSLLTRIADLDMKGGMPVFQAEGQGTDMSAKLAVGASEPYPNPFNPATTFSYELPENARVSIVIYDILGRDVAHLVNGVYGAGYHSVTWNATGVASGFYFARIQMSDLLGKTVYTKTDKLLLTK